MIMRTMLPMTSTWSCAGPPHTWMNTCHFLVLFGMDGHRSGSSTHARLVCVHVQGSSPSFIGTPGRLQWFQSSTVYGTGYRAPRHLHLQLKQHPHHQPIPNQTHAAYVRVLSVDRRCAFRCAVWQRGQSVVRQNIVSHASSASFPRPPSLSFSFVLRIESSDLCFPFFSSYEFLVPLYDLAELSMCVALHSWVYEIISFVMAQTSLYIIAVICNHPFCF